MEDDILPLSKGPRIIVPVPILALHSVKSVWGEEALEFSIRTFEVELTVPAEEIMPFGTFLQRPALRDDNEEDWQLPLFIWPYKRI